jgi:hypothetical protein
VGEARIAVDSPGLPPAEVPAAAVAELLATAVAAGARNVRITTGRPAG